MLVGDRRLEELEHEPGRPCEIIVRGRYLDIRSGDAASLRDRTQTIGAFCTRRACHTPNVPGSRGTASECDGKGAGGSSRRCHLALGLSRRGIAHRPSIVAAARGRRRPGQLSWALRISIPRLTSFASPRLSPVEPYTAHLPPRVVGCSSPAGAPLLIHTTGRTSDRMRKWHRRPTWSVHGPWMLALPDAGTLGAGVDGAEVFVCSTPVLPCATLAGALKVLLKMGPIAGDELPAAAGGELVDAVDGGEPVFLLHNGQLVRIAPRTANTKRAASSHQTHGYGIKTKYAASLVLVVMTPPWVTRRAAAMPRHHFPTTDFFTN